MAIATLDELKAQVAWTDDLGTDDDAILTAKLAAAQGHVERMLGHGIEATYADAVPAPLKEAVLQLAAWYYSQREAAAEVRLVEVPFGVREIVAEFRDMTF